MTCFFYAHLSFDTAGIILQAISCYLGLIMTFPFIFSVEIWMAGFQLLEHGTGSKHLTFL